MYNTRGSQPYYDTCIYVCVCVYIYIEFGAEPLRILMTPSRRSEIRVIWNQLSDISGIYAREARVKDATRLKNPIGRFRVSENMSQSAA